MVKGASIRLFSSSSADKLDKMQKLGHGLASFSLLPVDPPTSSWYITIPSSSSTSEIEDVGGAILMGEV